MEGTDSSINKNSFKNRNNNLNTKKDIKQPFHTLQPSIINDLQALTGSACDIASDDEDPYWN